MNITFLIGNGFDMASGIDTSYGAFYKWYCNKKSDKEHINKFKDNIKNDVKNGGKNWADFELGLGQYTKNFTVDTVNEFFECYEDAHYKIIEFLQLQQSQFVVNELEDNELAQFKNGIIDFYQDLNPQEIKVFNEIIEADKPYNSVINFLSFNYTNTLNNIVDIISKTPLKQWQYNGSGRKLEIDKKIIHMHGTATEYPVLGVDNESQISNKDLLSVPNFVEIMIKPQSVNAIGQLWHNEANDIISKSRIIGVFGMSIGESDAQWWKTIIQWLKSNANRHLIIYWYTKNPPNGFSILRKLEETKNAKDTLYKYCDLSPDEIKAIESRVHIAINTKTVLNYHFKKSNNGGEEQNTENAINDLGNSENALELSTFEVIDGVGKEIVVV